MPKVIDPAIKSQAQYMFVMRGMYYNEIAQSLGVHPSSVSRWAEEGGWEDLRALKNSSSINVELNAVKHLDMIFQSANREARPLTAKEVDMTSKLRKLIDSLNKDLSFITNGIEAIGQFMNFIREKDPEAFKALAEHSVEFTQDFASKYTRTS